MVMVGSGKLNALPLSRIVHMDAQSKDWPSVAPPTTTTLGSLIVPVEERL
jgi:hypothetical protein